MPPAAEACRGACADSDCHEPLQYQKQLRLQAARGRMLIDGLDAASAASEVGYGSASQFNREYSCFFGHAPMRDVRTLRSANAAALGD